jgi:glycosyltransferase involved in cell wall biosynthesis
LPALDQVVVYTDTWNIASRRGIEKAGFVPVAIRRRSALSKKTILRRLDASPARRGAAQLAILGSYPPPYGGVSVHVQRLGPLLKERGISYVVYNATGDAGDGERVIPVLSGRKRWMARYFFTAREPAIYLMSDRLLTWIMVALMARIRGKRVLIRLRNSALPDWIRESAWRRALAGFSLRGVAGVVCVSERLLEAAKSLGVPQHRLHFSPGFLPPATSTADRADVNPEVWEFIKGRRPIIAANGKVDWYRGQDLYGLDQLLELATRLKPDYPSLGVVVCMWNHLPGDDQYIENLSAEARRRGVSDTILFNKRSGVFVPVLAEADVFIRPTNTDGDANSVREGLYLGIPTLASDAVERPAGTIVFRTRDVDDMEAKVRSVLERNRSGQHLPPQLQSDDRARIDRYLELLESLATRSKSSTPVG